MTDIEMYEMICRMKQYGGAFVVTLSNAFRMADPINKQKLLNAFPEYVNEYGPNSKLPVKEL
jgi:hypothetical protein